MENFKKNTENQESRETLKGGSEYPNISIPDTPFFKSLAERVLQSLRKSELGTAAQNELDSKYYPSKEQVSAFDEIIDTSIGSTWQKMQKHYIKIGVPEKVFELLWVPQVRKALKNLIVNKSGPLGNLHKNETKSRAGNSYLLPKRVDSEAMLDFATKRTLLNEKLHLFSALVSAIFLSTEDNLAMQGVEGAFLFANMYLVLIQRYTRQQIKKIFNKRMTQGKKFSAEEFVEDFGNSLDLTLPKR